MAKPEVESTTKTGSAWFIHGFSQISQIGWGGAECVSLKNSKLQ
jgi:hypothetical protein